MASFKTKRVLVLYTGGTIGMEKNSEGVYTITHNSFLTKIKNIPDLFDADLANQVQDINENQLVFPKTQDCVIFYDLIEYSPLLDSCNVTLSDWIKIATDIKKNYKDFDGFVILHGTDTMAYTASALSFMIDGLEKPIIFTGAEISIFETRSDGLNNLISSLIISACYKIPEVCIFFCNKLLRANRATKVNTKSCDSFQSPNYAILGETETDIIIYFDRVLKPDGKQFKINTNLNTRIGILTFFPSITPLMIKDFLQPMDGVIIQTYGSGNIPSNQTQLVEALKKAIDKEKIVVNTTVCLEGSVSVIYESAQILEKIGVVSGQDMTVEAALTKLVVVLGQKTLSYKKKIQLLVTNLKGELTPASIKT